MCTGLAVTPGHKGLCAVFVASESLHGGGPPRGFGPSSTGQGYILEETKGLLRTRQEGVGQPAGEPSTLQGAVTLRRISQSHLEKGRRAWIKDSERTRLCGLGTGNRRVFLRQKQERTNPLSLQ